jgi:hypothetical protein
MNRKMLTDLKLDFNINARGQIQLHQRVNGFGRGLVNIDNPAVGAGFKMLSGILVNVGRSQHAINTAAGRQGNRANGGGFSAFSSFYNLFAGRIQQSMIKSFQADPNLLLLQSCR